jgi:hypothetical protein
VFKKVGDHRERLIGHDSKCDSYLKAQNHASSGATSVSSSGLKRSNPRTYHGSDFHHEITIIVFTFRIVMFRFQLPLPHPAFCFSTVPRFSLSPSWYFLHG